MHTHTHIYIYISVDRSIDGQIDHQANPHSPRSRWNEHHGFSFNADGLYTQPRISCAAAASATKPIRAPWPPPPPPTPPSPPAPPSPPPYPPLSAAEMNPSDETECDGITVVVDTERQDGVSITVSISR